MAELDTRLAIVPPYLRQTDDNTGSSFMQAYQEARKEQSPMYKAEVQNMQQQNTLFPLEKQKMEYQLHSMKNALDIQQQGMNDNLRTQDAAATLVGMMGAVDDWGNAGGELQQMGEFVSKHYTPKLGDMYQKAVDRAVGAKKIRDQVQGREAVAEIGAESREKVAGIRQDPQNADVRVEKKTMSDGSTVDVLTNGRRWQLVHSTKGPHLEELGGQKYLISSNGTPHLVPDTLKDKTLMGVMASKVKALNAAISKAKGFDANADTSSLETERNAIIEDIKNYKSQPTQPAEPDEEGDAGGSGSSAGFNQIIPLDSGFLPTESGPTMKMGKGSFKSGKYIVQPH